MKIYDGHAHFAAKEEQMVREKAGIVTMVCAGDPIEAEKLTGLDPAAYPWMVLAAGLHPWKADRFSVPEMLPFLRKCSVIGEIGMDSVWCQVPIERQKAVFQEQLMLAEKWKKPVVLHTKGMEKEILSFIKKYNNRYLVHWYSSMDYLDGYLEQDCYFTLGPDLMVNPAVRQVAERAPLNRLMVETDGFSAVTWALGDRKLEELPGILEKNMQYLAEIRQVSAAEIERQMEENFHRFLV